MRPEIRPKEDQNFWDFLFSSIFITLLGLSAAQIYFTRGSLPTSIPLFDALIVALAVFRLVRLLSYDKVMRFGRECLMQKKELEVNGAPFIELTPFSRGMRRTLYDLIQCPWCLGVWMALLVTFLYFEYPWAWYVILILAAAGVGSLIQIFANLMGWRAELDKMEEQEMAKKEQENSRC